MLRLEEASLGATARSGVSIEELSVGEGRLECGVLIGPALLVARLAATARLLVGQALLLGADEGLLLDEDAPPLVAPPATAERLHHRRQAARLLRPPRQRGVAGGQEDEVVQLGTGEAQRAGAQLTT